MNDFDNIYATHYKLLHRVAMKMIGDRDDVPDILQEIFIDFYNKTNNGSAIINPGRWLYKATVHKCIDALRKQKKFSKVDPLNSLCTVEENNSDREVTAIVDNAVSKLKPAEKALVTLYSEGLSYREMAEITGIKFSSIGKILSRTLQKLEKELKARRYELY